MTGCTAHLDCKQAFRGKDGGGDGKSLSSGTVWIQQCQGRYCHYSGPGATSGTIHYHPDG